MKNVVAEIRATPAKMAKAARNRVELLVTAIKDAAAAKVAEIRATPVKMAKAARNRVELLLTDISMVPIRLGLLATAVNPVTIAKPAATDKAPLETVPVKTPVTATLASSVPSPASQVIPPTAVDTNPTTPTTPPAAPSASVKTTMSLFQAGSSNAAIASVDSAVGDYLSGKTRPEAR